MPRRPLNPTDTQRAVVKSMAAIGIPHEQIARKIGIRSAKTLRKHFRDELDLGITEADYKVGQTLFNLATSGECPAATIFWSKTRLGLHERPAGDRPPAPLPPFIVALDPGGQQHGQA
jgi:hypothetical protein